MKACTSVLAVCVGLLAILCCMLNVRIRRLEAHEIVLIEQLHDAEIREEAQNRLIAQCIRDLGHLGAYDKK